jgi:hypothetical protein
MAGRFFGAYYIANAALLAAYGAAKLLHARNGKPEWGMIGGSNFGSWVRRAIGAGRWLRSVGPFHAPDIVPHRRLQEQQCLLCMGAVAMLKVGPGRPCGPKRRPCGLPLQGQ